MIPVFIHHELDEKPQTGGQKGQAYVKTCIRQAAKYNEEVVLFGDKSNQCYSDKWIDCSDFKSDKWESFLAVFENMSTYPDAWAKGIFKRFFVFEDYLEKTDNSGCIILDSDVLVWKNFSDEIGEQGILSKYYVAMEIPANQNMGSLGSYRWVACAGVSYFSKEAIHDFTNYCIDMYRDHKDVLRAKWDLHQKHDLAGGICEMSLLYLWQLSLDKCRILNLEEETSGGIPCVVINNIDLFNQWKSIARTGCLDIRFDNKIPYIIDKKVTRRVNVMAIHFGGKSKIFIPGMALGQRYAMLALVEWYYWEIRGKLSKVKRNIKKKRWN